VPKINGLKSTTNFWQGGARGAPRLPPPLTIYADRKGGRYTRILGARKWGEKAKVPGLGERASSFAGMPARAAWIPNRVRDFLSLGLSTTGGNSASHGVPPAPVTAPRAHASPRTPRAAGDADFDTRMAAWEVLQKPQKAMKRDIKKLLLEKCGHGINALTKKGSRGRRIGKSKQDLLGILETWYKSVNGGHDGPPQSPHRKVTDYFQVERAGDEAMNMDAEYEGGFEDGDDEGYDPLHEDDDQMAAQNDVRNDVRNDVATTWTRGHQTRTLLLTMMKRKHQCERR